MTKLDVAVPKTVLLPSNQHPDDTNANSFRNLDYPLNWDAMFSYVGFPAYFKPFAGGGWKNVYRLESPDDFFKAYNETGQLVMMLQEEINFTEYFRCYCLDRKDVHIMRYDPKQPHHLRYVRNPKPIEKPLLEKLLHAVLTINNSLGYDFNTVELAIRNGVPYAIDFCNPAPDADKISIGEENFDWIVDAAANMAIRRAKVHKTGQNNLTWGNFIKTFANNIPLSESQIEKNL
jgi:hypothetical protein